MRLGFRLPQHLVLCFVAVSMVFIFIYTQSTASEKPSNQSVSELEERVRDLQVENDKLAHEIDQLRHTIRNLVAQGHMAQEKRKTIAQVKRISQGRPKDADMMVGVPQLTAVWDQFDLILDKLDEITEQLSK